MTFHAPRPLLGTLALTATLMLGAAAVAIAQEAPAKPADPPAAPTAVAEPVPAAEPADEAPDTATIAAQEAEQPAIAKDLAPTLKPIYDLGDDDKKSPRIKVDAWVDKKDLHYKIGDTLTVYVQPKSDAYITILNVGSSGRVAVIYPNHYQRELKVKGGKTVRIPGKSAKWNIDVGGPSGVDLIKVIASKDPLTLKELEGLAGANDKNPFLTLGRSAEEAAKDLSPQLKPEGEGASGDAKFGVRNILVRVKKS